MINTWYKFNENKDNIRVILSEKLSEVREPFYELEDLGIIRYGIISSGYENSGISYFEPRVGDLEVYLDYITPGFKFTLSRTYKLNKLYNENSLILIDIKLSGESNEFGSTVIGNDGIKLFDDIISGVNRLKDSGFNVKLDFNSSHGEYKPLKILAYFNI